MRPQALATTQDGRTRLDVLAGLAPIGAALDPGRQHHRVALDPAIFLHEARVRSGRQSGASEHAQRRAARHSLGGYPPRSDAAAHR